MSTLSATHASAPSTQARGIDPRGPQFAAALTSVVLAAVLLLAPHPVGVALLAVQAVLFAVGAGLGGPRTPPAGRMRQRGRPPPPAPPHHEGPPPPRFAQTVGLAFTIVALLGFALGAPIVGVVATGFALAAAVLNAVFAFCLGCEMYLLIKRVTA